jgi:hypothetical protein
MDKINYLNKYINWFIMKAMLILFNSCSSNLIKNKNIHLDILNLNFILLSFANFKFNYIS